jgi:hypothetical protein
LEGNSFIAKGSKVKVSSNRIKEVFGLDNLEVYSTGFNCEESGVYMTTFEIDPDKKDLLNKAKLWIKLNQK